MDLSTLSDADLEALADNNMQGMSEAGLNAIAGFNTPANPNTENVTHRTISEQNISPFMSAVTGFNTGVGRLAHGILQPLTESGLLGDRVAQGSRGEAARREADYRTAAQANPKTAAISEFVGNVAPTLFVPGLGTGSLPVRLAKGAATGAGIGASQYVNPGDSRGLNALFGAAGGGLGAGLGEGLQAGLRYGNKLYAQSAMPGLVERASETIKNYIKPEQAAKTLQGNYSKANEVNESLWNQVAAEANSLDKSLQKNKTFVKESSILNEQGQPITKEVSKKVIDFDNNPFKQSLNAYIKGVKKLDPAERAQYVNAIGFAKYIKNIAPKSFKGVTELRKNLNEELKRYEERNNIKIADGHTKQLIGKMKGYLTSVANKNANKVAPDLFQNFKNDWQKANQSHMGLQEYFKRPNAEAVLKPTKQRREALQAGQLDRAAIGSYLRPSQGGMVGINQLNKLTGGDDAARSYLMRNTIEGRGQPNNALTAYERLSEPQRERLFAKRPEGDMLKAASAVRNELKEAPAEGWRWAGHHATALGFPGLLGFLGAKTLGGQDWDASIAAGMGTSALARGGQSLAARYANPASVMRAIQRAKAPSKNAGRFLSPELASLFSDRTPEAK